MKRSSSEKGVDQDRACNDRAGVFWLAIGVGCLLATGNAASGNSMYILYYSPLGGNTPIVDTFSNPTHAAVDLLDDAGQPYYTSSSSGRINVEFKTPNNAGRWEINGGGEFVVHGNWNGSNGLNTGLNLEHFGPCQGVSGLGFTAMCARRCRLVRSSQK
jgi:hypothetical protein